MIDVQRRLMIFVIKQIVPTAIVVIASMISLYLSAEEHTGDRTGMILVGALILIVNFQVRHILRCRGWLGLRPYLDPG